MSDGVVRASGPVLSVAHCEHCTWERTYRPLYGVEHRGGMGSLTRARKGLESHFCNSHHVVTPQIREEGKR